MRTEGDSWDITTSVGSTALFVATARALEAQKSDPLVVDPYAEAFCRAVGGSWADVLDGKLPDHKLKSTDFGEHFVNFQGARTKYFDEYFRRRRRRPRGRWSVLARGWRFSPIPPLRSSTVCRPSSSACTAALHSFSAGVTTIPRAGPMSE